MSQEAKWIYTALRVAVVVFLVAIFLIVMGQRDRFTGYDPPPIQAPSVDHEQVVILEQRIRLLEEYAAGLSLVTAQIDSILKAIVTCMDVGLSLEECRETSP